MIDWRDIRAEKPTQAGLYLICYPNPVHEEPWVDQCPWYAKGDRIYLDRPPGGGEEGMLEQIFFDEYTFLVPHDGFRTTDGDSTWEVGATTHWARIPNLPEGYTRSEDMP